MGFYIDFPTNYYKLCDLKQGGELAHNFDA